MTTQKNAHTLVNRATAEPTALGSVGMDEPLLNLDALRADLLDRAAAAQVALIQARTRGDRRGIDLGLLQLRASCLLLASVPAGDDAKRFAVLAAALLAEEDHDASSHARLMIEYAIRRNDGRATVNQQDYPATS